MGRRCFVKNCKSGHKGCKETVSTFKAPDDPQQLEAWAMAIGGDQKLTSKHYICEKHFASDMIKRDKYYGELGGEVLLDHPKRPKLLPGAVPCRLLFCPPSPKKKRPPQEPSAGDSQRNTKRTKTSMHDQPRTSASGSTSTGSSGLQEDANYPPGYSGARTTSEHPALGGNRTDAYSGDESRADASNTSPDGPLDSEEKECSSRVPAWIDGQPPEQCLSLRQHMKELSMESAWKASEVFASQN